LTNKETWTGSCEFFDAEMTPEVVEIVHLRDLKVKAHGHFIQRERERQRERDRDRERRVKNSAKIVNNAWV